MSTALLLVAILVPLIIVVLYFLNYYTAKLSVTAEGFTVKTCPRDSTNKQTISYVTDDGNTQCCSGEVIDNFCEKVFCSLSPGSSIRSCDDAARNQVQRRSEAKCPASVSGDCSNYFVNPEGTVKGCSRSELNSSLSGPSDISQPYCRLYDTPEARTDNYDSCQNYLTRYTAVTGLATCTTELARVRASIPTPSVVAPTVTAAPAAPVNPTGYVISGDGITGEIPVQKVIIIPGRNTPNDDGKLYLGQNGNRIISKAVNFDGSNSEQYSIAGTIPNTLNDFVEFRGFFDTLDRSTIRAGSYSVRRL